MIDEVLDAAAAAVVDADAVVALEGGTISDIAKVAGPASGMTSMLVAPADWRFASLVGTEEGCRPGAVRLLEVVGSDIDQWSPGVEHR